MNVPWRTIASCYSGKRKEYEKYDQTLKKVSQPLEEYLRDLKNICDNLVAIKKPILDRDKVF